MTFVKLHRDRKELLVNLSNVSEVYPTGNNKSSLYFSFEVNREQERITVDESLDEILELIEKVK